MILKKQLPGFHNLRRPGSYFLIITKIECVKVRNCTRLLNNLYVSFGVLGVIKSLGH